MNDQDQRVRDYYSSLSMSQEKLDQLLKATTAASEQTQADNAEATVPALLGKLEKNARVRTWKFWKAATPLRQWNSWIGVALACGLILTVATWVHNTGSQMERTERTLREVAMNHTTRLEPEYLGDSLAQLDNSMHQLPFALVLPKSIEGEYELIGSRYCSLSGVLAAHVRLQNKTSGKPMSLFVTSNAAELEAIRPQQANLEGLEVELWREGGLFYALAQRS